MSYYGSWKINDVLTFHCNTHDAATGAGTDADSVPSYRVYEDETGTAILNGSMAKLDDANTVGFYSEQITLSAANGFEKGKCYVVYISATVDSVTGTISHNFQVEAEVDANIVSDKTGYALSASGVDGVHDEVVEGSLTLRQIVRILLAALAGESTGGGTTSVAFRDNADSKNRIAATVDGDGNRTAVTLDAS